jgi:hypothetical protein
LDGESTKSGKGTILGQVVGEGEGLGFALKEAEIGRLRAANAQRDAEARLDILTKYTAPRRALELKRAAEAAGSNAAAKDAALLGEKARLGHLERQIEKCVILAPADGRVIHANDVDPAGNVRRVHIMEGAIVRERQVLFWVAPGE